MAKRKQAVAVEEDSYTQEIHRRFMLVVQRRNMTGADVARATKSSSAAVVEWLNRGVLPKGGKLAQFVLSQNLNGHWLLTGQGSMNAVGVGDGDDDFQYRHGAHTVLGALNDEMKRLNRRFQYLPREAAEHAEMSAALAAIHEDAQKKRGRGRPKGAASPARAQKATS